jgi:hypothetical protein
MTARKILIAPSYGAGWSTWNDDAIAQAMAEYQPIIDFLEAGGNPHELDDPNHPLLVRLTKELGQILQKELNYEPYICVLAASDLEVVTVHPPYRITEYDGAESLVTTDDLWE